MNDHAAVAEVFMTARNPRKTEVSLRDLTPADRLLFDEAKAKEWRSWLSSEAVELVRRGQWDRMVCLKGTQIDSVPLHEAIARIKRVDPEGQLVRQARAVGTCLGDHWP